MDPGTEKIGAGAASEGTGTVAIERLTGEVLAELGRLSYSGHTITAYRRMYDNLVRYAEGAGASEFDEGLAVSFVNGKFGTEIGGLYQAEPVSKHMKAYLRCMRVLLEWQLCGCVCKRVAGDLKLAALPEGLQELHESYVTASRAAGHSESTVYSRGNRVKHFLLFLADMGGTDAACLGELSAHDYMLTKASLAPKSVMTVLAALRSFYEHLYLSGVTAVDLTPTVPRIMPRHAPALPVTWTADDVASLLSSIDRANPTGKRDYAMLLMVARLGLRASDIRAVRVSDFDWDDRRISITQHKTGVPLELPLLEDVGWAVIEYLRDGRPEAATCPELFVRHVAPYDAFGDTSNLTYILSNRAREAGVSAAGGRRTLHSLRHALAKRLLDREVPIEDIARILGHVSTRTTSIYLRMDADELSRCPLDPEDGQS